MSLLIHHILIADDDEDDVLMFQSAVEETCPTLLVSIATDGQKLLNLLEKIDPPDAIVLDLNMPVKGGKECLREIRANGDFNRVPIIILSTSRNKKDIDYCLLNGANHYFVKPSTYSELRSIVENLCSGRLNVAN